MLPFDNKSEFQIILNMPEGTALEQTAQAAREVTSIFQHTDGVVDTDWYVEADQPKTRFVIDKEKAALHGISAETISTRT